MDQLKYPAHSPEIAVATPGRLDDFCSSGGIIMGNIKQLAADEDGRLLDVVLELQIRNMIEHYCMPQPGVGEG